MGELHARVYASTPGASITALCDIDRDRALKVNDLIGNQAHVYTDYREMLSNEDISAVSIVLPDFLHCDAAIAAAQAGKHILLEKPLATSEDDGQKILKAVESANVY